MKIRLSFLIIAFCLSPLVSQAQDLNSKILLDVDGNKVQAGEFIRMYKKSIEPGKTLDINDYLQQFIIFKLKVADALHEGIDTAKSFRDELNGYRNQLAENYLTDAQTKEKLLQKAYQRSLTELNAWHILIALAQDATPADTIKAWKKAIDVRERIIRGEPFESVARGTSDDKSVKINGGNLGYFSVFQMIMPFEDAAYNLKINAISMPVRSPYGYHIIKVAGKRPSRGKIKVAHIMKSVPPGSDDKVSKDAEEAINNIYKMLQQGISFSDLAKKYSDHKASAEKGGELEWFGAGDIISDFAEAAFAIPDTGTYSKPVHTMYGWHIIKLLGKKAPGTFEESRSFLESKINQSYLNSLSRKSFVDKLKKEYKFQVNQEAYKWFVTNTDTLISKGLKKYDHSTIPAGNLYSFANQVFTTKDFANYIETRGPVIVTRDSSVFINRIFDLEVTDNIISYENSILEKKYPEFRYLMNEFHDGMLLFEISNRLVWKKVSTDSVGLQNYYEENKNKWLSKRSIEGEIYTLKDNQGKKILETTLKKFAGSSDMDDRLNKKFNKADTLLLIKHGTWTKGDNADIDKTEWTEGLHTLENNGFPSVLYIKKVGEPAPIKLKEIQGDVMTGYQTFLEKEWVSQLIKKYPVKTDDLVFQEVKKKINQ
jgi:peptidyl-prolyl cis-trans isomerase SurA